MLYVAFHSIYIYDLIPNIARSMLGRGSQPITSKIRAFKFSFHQLLPLGFDHLALLLYNPKL